MQYVKRWKEMRLVFACFASSRRSNLSGCNSKRQHHLWTKLLSLNFEMKFLSGLHALMWPSLEWLSLLPRLLFVPANQTWSVILQNGQERVEGERRASQIRTAQWCKKTSATGDTHAPLTLDRTVLPLFQSCLFKSAEKKRQSTCH